MADVSVKMGVSGISQFRSEINQAQASVKTYDSALKLAEKQFRATGDAEKFMQDKTTALQGKLTQQQSAVKSMEAALKTLKQNGVDPASQAYQKMENSLLQAQAAVLDTQNEINNLGTESADAAGKTDQLADSLGGLNRKVSLQQVISGIDHITDGMEKAAGKAVELGKAIWENITDAARWGDDTATQAMILNMDVETYERYKKVFDTVGELTVQEWQKAKLKVQKAVNDPSQDQTDILNLLGINTHEIMQGKNGVVEGAARDFEDVFWEIGDTLRKKVESGEMTQDLADTYANALFGRTFANLNPMFALGREGFAAALDAQNVVTEETVNKLAGLNDELIKLQGDFDTLKAEVLGGLAPALQGAAEVLDSLLGRLIDYLQTEEGQKAIEDLGKAVEGLFSDLGEIDPEQVVEGFANVFNGIVDGMKWLSDNSGTVIGAMEAIVAGWAGLKLTGGALQILNLINGLKGLQGAGAAAAGAGEAAGGGAAAAGGASMISKIGTALAKAVPVAAGVVVLSENAITAQGNDDVIQDESGTWRRVDTGEEIEDESIVRGAQVVAEIIKGAVEEIEEEWVDLGGETTEEEKIDAAQMWWDAYRDWQSGAGSYGDMLGLYDYMATAFGEDFDRVMDGILDKVDSGEFSGLEDLPEDFLKTFITPEFEEGSEAELQGQLDAMHLRAIVEIDPRMGLSGFTLMPHANGLWSVPFDGYAALLHKGERVVPAREAEGSRSYSSNLYIESMYMNNGQDAEGLAAAIAAANRRTMRGYGS